MVTIASWRQLLQRIHHNEEGSVSLETVLIIGAIALPVLIFLLKVGWPAVKEFFNNGIQELSEASETAES